MKFLNAISKNPNCNIFSIENDNDDDCNNWELGCLNIGILPEKEGYYILKAKNIISKEKIIDCYINITMNERINDDVYLVDNEKITSIPTYKIEGDIICAVPIDAFGQYDIFYSKIYPEIGINILKEGFNKTKSSIIAEDLAYILRDENQNNEAIKYFTYSAENNPSSHYIFYELAQLYKIENNLEKYNYYIELFNKNDQNWTLSLSNIFLIIRNLISGKR